MSLTAVVILNWNGLEYLRKFLPFLIKHTNLPDVELVVADNGSSDQSIRLLETDYPSVRIIKLDKNHGFAGGYNKALEKIDADYYMLLNSDIEVSENWLEPLISLMDKQQELAACSPLLIDFNKRDNYEYAGAAGGYIDKYAYTFCRGRIFDKLEKINPEYNNNVEVFWTTGACMLVRAELFRSTGGFDEHFFAHMEEVDLCWRWKNMGHKLMINTDSRVYHVGGGTLPKSNPFKTYLNFRNNLFLLYKNLPENKLDKILFLRLLLDYLSVIRFLVTLSFKDIGAIFKAHRHFFKKKKDYREFRKIQSDLVTTANHREQYNRSIVVDYFLLGRKTFTRLRGGFADKFINTTSRK